MTYGDLADRATIQVLKELNNAFDEKLRASDMLLELFNAGVTPADLKPLVDLNAAIWELEADIRNMSADRESNLTLVEQADIGVRTLRIRQLNRKRVAARNAISQRFGQPQEIKVNHASA